MSLNLTEPPLTTNVTESTTSGGLIVAPPAVHACGLVCVLVVVVDTVVEEVTVLVKFTV